MAHVQELPLNPCQAANMYGHSPCTCIAGPILQGMSGVGAQDACACSGPKLYLQDTTAMHMSSLT
jgi:hypothetical protein